MVNNTVSTTKRLSTEAAKARIADDDWDASNWSHPAIYDALLQDLGLLN
jgi:hypothetical protein